MKTSDLSDRLHPMIVKELRQGLHSKGFVMLHLALQGLLVFVILIFIFERISGSGSIAEAETAFRALLAALLLIGMPLLAFLSGVRMEKQAGTYEMLLITSMRPVDIERGKWLTRILQALLLLSSILPYGVVRYVLGRVELFEDIVFLFWLLVISCLLMSICNRLFSAFSRQRSIGLLLVMACYAPYFIAMIFERGLLGFSVIFALVPLWLAIRIPRNAVILFATMGLWILIPLFLNSLFSGHMESSIPLGILSAVLGGYTFFLYKTIPEIRPYPIVRRLTHASSNQPS